MIYMRRDYFAMIRYKRLQNERNRNEIAYVYATECDGGV